MPHAVAWYIPKYRIFHQELIDAMPSEWRERYSKLREEYEEATRGIEKAPIYSVSPQSDVSDMSDKQRGALGIHTVDCSAGESPCPQGPPEEGDPPCDDFHYVDHRGGEVWGTERLDLPWDPVINHLKRTK